MKAYWHIIKGGRFSPEVRQAKWDEELSAGFISAGYGNEPDGRGRKKLAKYLGADVYAYIPGYGMVGTGKITGSKPTYFHQESVEEHAHRLTVAWDIAVPHVSQAVCIDDIRALGASAPRTLATRIAPSHVNSLRGLLATAAK